MPFKYPSMSDRIRANAQWTTAGDCWVWGGKLNSSGYGVVSIRRKSGFRKGKVQSALAHRVSYEAFNQVKLRKTQVLMHRCDNRQCVNPEHLKIGTQKKNVRDCIEKGRHYTPFAKKAA